MDLEKEGYALITEDHRLEVRRDPREESGYIIRLKKEDKSIIFPRGTLEELAKSDRDRGREIIQHLTDHDFFEAGRGLTYDSINAIATKAWLTEVEEYHNFQKTHNL